MNFSVYKLYEPFDLTQYKNTRFMYNPTTKEIILGSEHDSVENGSHAQMYYNAKQNTNTGYDDFNIKGWIGFGGRKYQKGVIHFAPNIRPEQSEAVMEAIALVEKLKNHGFTDNTWVRGLVRFDEYKIKDMYEKIQNWQDDVRPYTQQLQDWVNCSFVKDKVYKIAEGVYTSDKIKARYHNSDLKPYFLLIDSPFYSNGKLSESFSNLSKKGFNGIIQGKTFRVFNESEQVKEANAQKDNEIREKVRNIFLSLVKSIQKNPNIGEIVGTNNGYGYFINITQALKYFYPDYNSKPLYVLIKSADRNYGMYSKTEDYNIIIMNILSENQMMEMATKQEGGKKSAINQFIKKTIVPILINENNTFIHEFIHALDNVRLKNYKGRKESQLNITNTQYLSDPLEFNAWFQSNIYDFDKDANNEPALKKDWKLFYTYVLDCLPFVKEYDEKYRRKFDVRLWKYWNEFIKDGGKKEVSEAKFNYGNLYHGTNASFDVFNKEYITGGFLGKGFYFTMSKNMAKSYGKNVIEAKLNYNNSFMFDSDILDEKSLIKMLSTIPNWDKNTIETNKNIYLKQIKDNAIYDANKDLFSYIDFYKGDTTKILKELGYDSIDNIERDSEFLVFEPAQIKIIKQVNESLKNEGGFFITSSGRDILNLLQNKPKEYRIVYDANLNLFMICDANEGIHGDMLEKAYKNGLYYNMDKFIDSLGSFQNYIETGQDGGWDENDNEINSFLYYMVFDPTGQWEVGDDDYDTVYKLPFGNLFTRKCDLSEIPFYDMLPLTEQLNEGVNTQYLYHAMWKKQFLRCKKDNRLYSHTAHENYKTAHRTIKGISTSRNLNVCIKFMERAIKEMTDEWEIDPTSYFAMNDTGNDGTTHYIDKGADLSYVVLVFDREKLKQNHKIIPHSYIGGQMRDTFGDEQEELIVGDLPNFMDYVVDVIEFNNNINPKTLKSKKNVVESEEPNLNQNFWNWFNGSKVVDEDGSPLVVYHGTASKFDVFGDAKFGDYGKGYYFVDHKLKANEYAIKSGGNVIMSAYLSIKNPYIARSSSESQLRSDIGEKFTKSGLPIKKEKITEILSQDGYDGVIIPIGEKPFGFNYYLCFNKNQIKSVDNCGDWSNDSDNINEVNESVEPNLNQNFWSWFGDSVCVDDTGAPLVLYHGTSSEFNKFKKGLIFTTDNEQVADGYGYYGAMPVFVRIRKPFIVDAFNQDWQEIYNAEGFKKKYKDLTDEDIEKLYKAYDYFESLEDAKQYYEESKKYNPDDYINLARAYGQKPYSTNEWAQYAKNKGYDGCIIKNVVDGFSLSDCINPINEYIVWNPKQVKSVNNNGEWSESDKLMESFDTRKITVYHGSSDKDLKIKDNSTIFFTNNKEDAKRWAERQILGGKKNKENYIYKAEITFNKPYIIGDSTANPEYAQYKDITNEIEKKDIYTEIFFDDITNNYQKLVAKGYDCFIDNMIGNNITYYVIPSELKNNIRWLKVEKI